jgi:hypothetical protein
VMAAEQQQQQRSLQHDMRRNTQRWRFPACCVQQQLGSQRCVWCVRLCRRHVACSVQAIAFRLLLHGMDEVPTGDCMGW